MRYITHATLLTRMGSNASTTIFIPPGEVIETESESENPLTVRLVWRGQSLCADGHELSCVTESAEFATP